MCVAQSQAVLSGQAILEGFKGKVVSVTVTVTPSLTYA